MNDYLRRHATEENDRRERGDKGFTLIELLIVIVILSILAAIVIFSVGGVTNKGSTAACQTDVKTIDTAAEAFYAQNGTAAASLAALVPGFLHPDSSITTNTQTGSGYIVTFYPAGTDYPSSYDSGAVVQGAGDALSNLTGCP